jgi:hypothetical protein
MPHSFLFGGEALGVRKLACAFMREASFAHKGGSKLPHSKAPAAQT